MALVPTSKGILPEEMLRKRIVTCEIREMRDPGDPTRHDPNGVVTLIESWSATEYYDGDELVHRSASTVVHVLPAGMGAILEGVTDG